MGWKCALQRFFLSSPFSLTLFYPLTDFFSSYLHFSPPFPIFGTKCPKTKQGRDRARSPPICSESVSHWERVNTSACSARTHARPSRAHMPLIYIFTKKGPSGFPSSAEPSAQPHQHTPAWLSVRAWRRVPGWDRTSRRRTNAQTAVFLFLFLFFFYARKCASA